MFWSSMLTELGFGKEFEQVPLHIDNTATLHVIGNRAFSSQTKHVALRFFYIRGLVIVGWWRRSRLLHITYRRSVNSLTSERSLWTRIVFNNFYSWSRAFNFVDVIVGVLCSFVGFSVIQFSVSEVKICFLLYQTFGFKSQCLALHHPWLKQSSRTYLAH